jgi:hypothetical protein
MTATALAARTRRRPWTASPVIAAVAVALAACSGKPSSPTVAHLGSSSATTTAAPSPGGSAADGRDLAKMESYAQCMRTHGIPDFPDPTPGPGGGGFQLRGGPGSDLDQGSPTFQAADKACTSLLPNGGVAPQLTAAQQQQFLNWAACIRAHGLPDFADPDFSGGGVAIHLSGGAGLPGGRGPSAQFQAAQRACKSKLPGGFGGLG